MNKPSQKPLLTVSDDGMKALLNPGSEGAPIQLEELTRLINDSGIVFGIKKDALRNISLVGFRDNGPVVVATGQPPINGRDAELVICFRPMPDRDSEGTKKSAADLITKNKISKKNEVLAVKLRPTHGLPGRNVYGQLVEPEPGNDIQFEPGKNVQTRFYPDKIEFSAMCEGIVKLGTGSLEVSSLAVIEHDVDLSTGNIDFAGNLLITGSVCRGFKVTCQGNVKIEGNVDGGIVFADGDIIIQGTVLGSSEIHSGGTIKAKHIEHSKIEAASDIEVQDGIMQCEVVSGSKIKLITGRGILAGGVLKVKDGLEAKIIGTPMATPTTIHLGGDFFDTQQMQKLEVELTSLDQEIDRLQNTLKPFLSKEPGAVSLPSEKKWAFRSLANRLKDLKVRRNSVRVKIAETDQVSMMKTAIPQRIVVHHTVHEGVSIHIGLKTLEVEDELNQVSIFESPVTHDIVVTNLDNR